MTFDIAWGGLHTVISGGQTGADQGGLLAAWAKGVKTGGTAPKLYKTSAGLNPLLEVLGLEKSSDYNGRTKINVHEADGTVLIAHHLESPGSALTRRLANEAGKPILSLNVSKVLHLSMEGPASGTDAVLDEIVIHALALKDFVAKHQLQVLNVAGNREVNSSSQYGALAMTSVSRWIVGLALDLLEADGQLILKS